MLWGARCGKIARRVLRGGRKPRNHAGSVRALVRKQQTRRGSAKANVSRLLSTHHSIVHEWLAKFIEHRVADRRVLRLIQKWLNAGVLEDGRLIHAQKGTPQGGSASPLLANVYLHYVYDLWVQWWRKKHAHGDVIVVRFADDTIVGFQYASEARRFLSELTERYQKFGLELHPEKTRLIQFGRFAAERRAGNNWERPETFTFLGFTHVCAKTKEGRFTVLRLTMRQR